MSIGAVARHIKNNNVVGATRSLGGKRRVLPHVLRRPVRQFNRLLAGDISISKRGWSAIGAVAILAAGISIFANSRHGHSIAADFSAHLGFTISNVVIEGTQELSKIDVLTNLDLGRSNSLLTFDIAKARDELRSLAWVKDVRVAKSYPDRLVIRVSERQPYAIWQQQDALLLVERNGKAIDNFDEKYAGLPLLVGKGANLHGADIIFLVGKVPFLKNRVRSFVRIADRRWDLHLSNGIVVRLPDENSGVALKELARLEKAHKILDRDLRVVDLRLNNRLVVSFGEAVASLEDEVSGVATSISLPQKTKLPTKRPVVLGEKKI
ncbi:MAG: FtsQ-type POTRA domain-containing protein [Hyphomicrobiales bacterium]|nr:FtsQ-type POTRA domain-containing protein [Hyphomicrobiales bacterium]